MMSMEIYLSLHPAAFYSIGHFFPPEYLNIKCRSTYDMKYEYELVFFSREAAVCGRSRDPSMTNQISVRQFVTED